MCAAAVARDVIGEKKAPRREIVGDYRVARIKRFIPKLQCESRTGAIVIWYDSAMLRVPARRLATLALPRGKFKPAPNIIPAFAPIVASEGVEPEPVRCSRINLERE